MKVKFWLLFLVTLLLTACNSGGSCNGCSSNNVIVTPTFSITAPAQYPVSSSAIIAYLTITNTSSVNASNIQYSIPSAKNTTGVSVVIDPDGNNQGCDSIAAGQSCIFTATIGAGANPGGFSVVAVGSTSGSSTHNLYVKFKSLFGIKDTTTSAAVAVNISLISTPANSNLVYLMPSSQLLSINNNESTVVMFSLLVQSVTSPFNTINLVDNNGNSLTAALISPAPNGNYAVNDVATFSVVLPKGWSSSQLLQAYLFSASTALACNGTNNCSNMASINFAPTGTGILTLAPFNTKLDSSYESQIYTLTNTGESIVSNITLPVLPVQFSISNNSCTTSGTGTSSLAIGASCNYTVNYDLSGASGNYSNSVSYTNGVSDVAQSTVFNIDYTSPNAASIIINSAVLAPRESAGIGTASSPYYVESQTNTEQLILTYINQGSIDAESFSVNPNMLSTGYSINTNNCNSVVLGANGEDSCTVMLDVTTTVAREQNLSLESGSIYASWKVSPTESYTFQTVKWYNESNSNVPQESVFVNIYNRAVITACLGSESGVTCNATESVVYESSIYIYYQLSGGYPGQAFDFAPIPPKGMDTIGASSCPLTATGSSSVLCLLQVLVTTKTQTGNNSIDFGSSNGFMTTPASESIAVYPLPLISYRYSISPGESIVAGESFTVTATLTGGLNIDNQLIESLSLTPRSESFIFSSPAVPCYVSSANPICTMSVIVESSAESGGYSLYMHSTPLIIAESSESITFIVTPRSSGNYVAYVANGSSPNNKVFACTMDSSGIFTACSAQPISGGVIYPTGITLATFNDILYPYTAIDGGGAPYQCSIDSSSGALINCNESSPTGATLTSISGIAIAALGGTSYTYLSNRIGSSTVYPIYKCTMNSTGGLTSCTDSNTISGNPPQGLYIESLASAQYLYALSPTISKISKCELNSSNGDFVGSCTLTPTVTPSGWGVGSGLGFATMQNESTYAYVPAYSGSNNVFKCSVDNSSGAFSDCEATPTSGVPSWTQPRVVTVVAINGVQYAYVATGSSVVYQCPLNNDGSFGTCIQMPSGVTSSLTDVRGMVFVNLQDL